MSEDLAAERDRWRKAAEVIRAYRRTDVPTEDS